MKKLTSITAALFMATAFCGVCAGCASEINANAGNKNTDPIAPAPVVASEEHKVILCPGSYYSGSTVTANTVDTGAAKLNANDEEAYYVTNAYFATVAAGENLPAATTTRTQTTFEGWTYAVDGEVVTITTMPATLNDDLYLYAKWKNTGSIAPDPGPDPGPGPDPTPSEESYMQVGTQKYTLSRNTGNTTREEYWLGGAKVDLSVGDTISLYMDGQRVSAYIESNSSGVDLGDSSTEYSQFTVNLAGSFVVYLHKNASDWSVQFVVTTPVEETTVTIPANAAKSEITFKNGKITVYIKEGNNYATSLAGYNLYMWNGDDQYLGAWPGTAMSAAMSAATKDLTGSVNFIVNKTSGGQTRDLAGMEVGGTYIITFADQAGDVQKVKVA